MLYCNILDEEAAAARKNRGQRSSAGGSQKRQRVAQLSRRQPEKIES